jgi:glycosyltransferase involved in cell wall biosynthesis
MSTTHRLAYKLFFESDLRKSKYVLTISKGTADRIYSLFARKVDDIVYPSVGKDFKVTHSSDTKRKILEKFGLNSPFILAVATWEPRKNLELLINCFIDLKQSGFLPRHDLVLAGGRGWKDERLLKLIGIQKSIRPLGYVPDIDLPILYSSADLFVFPSQYEGFGMPVLEARTCGATVVTSDIPELREAGGKDSCYVEPTATALKAAILNKLALEKTKTNDMLPNTTDWPHWIDSAKILSSYLNG